MTPLRRRAALLKEIEAVLLPGMRIQVWNHVGGACYGACSCGRPVVAPPAASDRVDRREWKRDTACARCGKPVNALQFSAEHNEPRCPTCMTTPPPEAATTEETKRYYRVQIGDPPSRFEEIVYEGDPWFARLDQITGGDIPPAASAAEARPEQTGEERRMFWRCDHCGATVTEEFQKDGSLNHLGGFGFPCKMFTGTPERWTRVIEIDLTPGQRAGR